MDKLKIFLIICLVCLISRFSVNLDIVNKKNTNKIIITNKNIKEKYFDLVKVIGDPTYLEIDGGNKMNSATWMSPRENFNDFGKYGGCDYIKLYNHSGMKYHPHPAPVFVIVGKYINVPEKLFGPLKYASETINIEQILVPENYAQRYGKTGKKEIALVTGSCGSVTISVITIQFVIDMIKKHKNSTKCLELYDEFRQEYDRRINDYLCGDGITDKIEWFDNKFFNEPDKYYIGDEKCKNVETFSGCGTGHGTKRPNGVETFAGHDDHECDEEDVKCKSNKEKHAS